MPLSSRRRSASPWRARPWTLATMPRCSRLRCERRWRTRPPTKRCSLPRCGRRSRSILQATAADDQAESPRALVSSGEAMSRTKLRVLPGLWSACARRSFAASGCWRWARRGLAPFYFCARSRVK
eukprot:Amastigsp_a512176_8.p5 type:complete len:125 gc:universal Amastigsp_a512176_8:925-551(-)